MHFPLPPALRRSQHPRQELTRNAPDSSRDGLGIMKPFLNTWRVVVHHATRHLGVGIICAVAYFDPGNWSVDLQAGSQFGYKLLFAVLLSGIGAVILQALACKLGCVTGLDLAQHCRLLLNNHPRFPRLVRIVFLYPLYVLSELAIISTDLAELLGSAIGLVLLFPSLPLPIAVLLTATDVVFILALGDSSKNKGRPVRVLEFIIIVLVLVVFVSFIILIVKVKPHWPEVFNGYLPSRTLVEPSGLYSAIGILGATVMPHALYLGSYLATHDRVSTHSLSEPLSLPVPAAAPQSRIAMFRKAIRKLFSVSHRREVDGVDVTTPHGERDNNAIAFIRAHLKHGIWDIVMSLLGFAVVINSAILVLAGAVFFFGPGRTDNMQAAGLFDAFDLIKKYVGKAAAIMFALALICSGQSASITATLAGQIVSEGFIQWSISPFLRRLLTRLFGLIPSMTVAIAVGRPGIDTLLVISQVILSIVLPFVMFPLIWLTSSSMVMRVRKPHTIVDTGDTVTSKLTIEIADEKLEGSSSSDDIKVAAVLSDFEVNADARKFPEEQTTIEKPNEDEKDRKGKGKEQAEVAQTFPSVIEDEVDYVDYSNGWALSTLCYAVWVVVVVANGYLIVTLAIG